MKYNYYEAKSLSTVPNNSYLMLDNIYDALHEANINGESVYYYYMGMYFLSRDANNENDRNNMYMKLFGKSRAKYIKFRLECLREDLLNLGIKASCDLNVWVGYIDDYINNIDNYPYTDPLGFFEMLLRVFKKNSDSEEVYGLIDQLYQDDQIILKGVGILLKDTNPLKERINALIGTTRQ